MINYVKSILDPVQEFQALGLQVDLHKGFLSVPLFLQKGYQKEARKISIANFLTPSKVTAILGRFPTLLPALHAFRAFTDLLVSYVHNHLTFSWGAR